MTPFANAEMSVACGAASGCIPGAGAPGKPYARANKFRIGGMTSDPTMTPASNATCCFQGVAPTSWPVFKSCKLSFAIVATHNRIAVTNNEYATSACPSATTFEPASASSNNDAPITARIAKPETGLFEEPINPAIYPHAAATANPATTTYATPPATNAAVRPAGTAP